MVSRRRYVVIAARTLVCVLLLAGACLTIAGIITGSAVATTNGTLLFVGVALLVGVVYAAVFLRDDQVTRRAARRPH